MHRLAEATKQADRLGHEHRRIHPLARNIAQTPGNAAIAQQKKIIEVAGNLKRRQIQPVHGEIGGWLGRQKIALNLARQIEFALHALLLDQRLGHLRVMHGQRNHPSQYLQELLVGQIEQPVTLALVDHLQRPEHDPLDA